MIEHAAFVPHLSGMRNLRLWWEAGGAPLVRRRPRGRARGRRARRRDRAPGQDLLAGHAPAARARPGPARPARAAAARRADQRPRPAGDARGPRAACAASRTQGVTVLLSSHLLAEIEQVCSHVVVMDKGQLVTTGTVRELLADEHAPRTSRSTTSSAPGGPARATPGRRAASPTSRRALSVELDGVARSALVAALVQRGDRGRDRHRAPPARGRVPRPRRPAHRAPRREGRLMLRLIRHRARQAGAPARARGSRSGFVVIVPIIIAVALKLNPPDLSAAAATGHRYFFLATQSGLFLPVAALRLMSGFFLVVVICMFAGDAIASEAGLGQPPLPARATGRPRPAAHRQAVRRRGVRGARRRALVALSGLIAGVIAFGWHPITIPFIGLSQSPSEHPRAPRARGRAHHLGARRRSSRSAFMLSTMTDSAAGAIFGAVGLYIVSLILNEITSLGSIRYGLPVRYYDAWSDLFTAQRVHRRHVAQHPAADPLRDRVLRDRVVVVPPQGHQVLTKWRAAQLTVAR